MNIMDIVQERLNLVNKLREVKRVQITARAWSARNLDELEERIERAIEKKDKKLLEEELKLK